MKDFLTFSLSHFGIHSAPHQFSLSKDCVTSFRHYARMNAGFYDCPLGFSRSSETMGIARLLQTIDFSGASSSVISGLGVLSVPRGVPDEVAVVVVLLWLSGSKLLDNLVLCQRRTIARSVEWRISTRRQRRG